jgi:phosphoenolpyruvate synthase/pyruvate phosphate dikinase
MVSMGMKNGTKKILKYSVNISFKIENNAIEWFYLPKNWRAGHNLLVKKIKQDPQFLRHVYKQMVTLGNRQIKFARSIKPYFIRASNDQLFKFYQQFFKYNIELYSYGLLLPLLDFQNTTFLTDELRSILKKRGADKYFNLLTIPLKQTAVKNQELDLLRIAGLLVRQPGCRRLFLTKASGELIAELKKQFPKTWQKIKNHGKKYCWAYYVYEGPATDEKYFVELLQDLIKRKINPVKELEKYRWYLKQTVKKQSAVLEALKLNGYERQIMELARDGIFYKAYRRELQSRSYYLIESLLAEIGRRLQLSLKQVRMILPDELKAALNRGKNFLSIIQERQKLLLFNYTAQGRIICLAGGKAKKFIRKNVVIEKLNLKAKFFTGTVAYPGEVKGKVKIINTPTDMVKMERGDILIATTTNPNLMPAIRLAKAMVTEEGGLTCHAAIVSRELRIPCVVGVKAVAHALKDGDLAEVDANKGVVKIIKN